MINFKKNLQNKTALTAGAIAASVVGYFIAKNINNQTPEQQLVPQTIEMSTTTGGGTVSEGTPEEQCQADVLPSFINHSLAWPDTGDPKYSGAVINEIFKKLTPPSIIVTSAGNNGSRVPGPTVDMSLPEYSNAIIVGSMRPDGSVSGFSSRHERVNILAPSDFYIDSTNIRGKPIQFSGTSGAAPLVTGSLAGFEWISDYHPTADEAKLLLEKTAIPTLTANTTPRVHGAGMVNAYKLGMVGKKLKEACGTDVACFQRKINESETYVFSTPSSLLSEVESAFPHCSATICRSESNATCFDKKVILNKLRKAAFLSPQDKNLWRTIACIYESNDFPYEAKMAMNTYRALFGTFRDSYIDRSCSSDSDCTYIPNCNNLDPSIFSENNSSILTNTLVNRYDLRHSAFIPANKNFVNVCQGRILCNNKCRCGSTVEYYRTLDGIDRTQVRRQAKCVNSICYETKTTTDEDEKGKTFNYHCPKTLARCRKASVPQETKREESGRATQ